MVSGRISTRGSVRAPDLVPRVGVLMHDGQEAFGEFVYFALANLVRGQRDVRVVSTLRANGYRHLADTGRVLVNTTFPTRRRHALPEIPIGGGENIIYGNGCAMEVAHGSER